MIKRAFGGELFVVVAIILNKSSGELRRSHHIDLKIDMYRGRPILPVKRINCLSDANNQIDYKFWNLG
ncbi:hypothetical protein [Bartonella sp. C271]|uniref:hypothetical protein n=1 Tax=Bartonella sp. C271 TaxID=3070220 RepID=UPI0038B54200